MLKGVSQSRSGSLVELTTLAAAAGAGDVIVAVLHAESATDATIKISPPIYV